MLLPNCFLDDLDFFVGQPVQLVHDHLFTASGSLASLANRVAAPPPRNRLRAVRPATHSLKKLDQKHPDPPCLAASPLGFPRSLRDLAPLGPGELPHFVRQMLLPNSLFHNFDFLVGQPVQLVDDFVDEVVGALDLRLQLLGAFLRLDVAL